MFDFLKKKISSWLKPSKAKKPKKDNKNKEKLVSTKKGKKAKEKTKNTEEITEKEIVENKLLTKDEKQSLSQTEQILKEAETPLERQIEEEKVPEKEEEKETQGFFAKLIKKISTSKLSQQDFDEIFQELEITLLENNVALEAVDAIRLSLSNQLVNQQIKKTEASARVLQALKDSILSLLIEPPNLLNLINKKSKEKESFTIIFFGINGTGKTTSIAKLAHLLQKNNISSVLAAADTFRAASIEQLQTHANILKVPIISSKYGSDPASVAFDAKKYASSHKIKVVLIDTAGRMYTKANLLKEMEKIIRISQPDLKIFVGESITGNDMIEQAKTFNESIGIDGIILSKADIDKKAGSILSISHITKKPIFFLGTGQKYTDLIPFTKKEVLKNLGLE